ncbi:hypothetical protein KQX54_014866 [Cotesia glomerata]|uniref:Uncharacterized protein n=1 Tax=Cotesia glomerata TaxID=32391 RepID=A0AAV7HXX2_COTGL|nr:hypothetical protein KQX54_014866 [Cotesia glomerata]
MSENFSELLKLDSQSSNKTEILKRWNHLREWTEDTNMPKLLSTYSLQKQFNWPEYENEYEYKTRLLFVVL